MRNASGGRLTPGVLALLCLCMLPGTHVAAQDRPLDLGGSPDRSLGDLTGENDYPLQVTGFGVGDYSYDPRANENTARAGKLALSMFREASERFWFFGQLTTALASGEEAAVGPGEEVPTEIEIDNLLVSYTPGGASGVSLSFGKFDVPIGFERDDEPLNLQASTSFNYELARPAKMVGLVGRWELGGRVGLTGLVGNGWDSQLDDNTSKTVGLRLGLTPTEHSSLGLAGVVGNEGEPDDVHRRDLLTVDYAVEPGSGWIVAGEANWASDREVLPSGGDAAWYGATLTVFRRLGDSFGVTARGETFRDRDGVRTGDVQTLQSFTLGPMYMLGTGQEGIFANVEHTTFRIPRLQIRAEVRLDHSSEAVFEGSDGLHTWATHYVLQLVTTF